MRARVVALLVLAGGALAAATVASASSSTVASSRSTQAVVRATKPPARPGTIPAIPLARPSQTGKLPFTGAPAAIGLILGIALVCSGTLLLLQRADRLEGVLAQQAAALARLKR